MSISPHITFKAGKCDYDSPSKKVLPNPDPGYLYLYTGVDDDLIHFCWRDRSASLSDPSNLDLVMVPMDGSFKPYVSPSGPKSNKVSSPVPGRVCVLKFGSSEARYFFWLQSREQPPGKENQSTFSERDLRLCKIVDSLLQGEEVENAEVQEVRRMGRGSGGDADTAMEDAGTEEATGGAGPDATGGDIREEGEESREGGADGGRASHSTQQQPNLSQLLASINTGQRQAPVQQLSTTLPDLLPTSTTVPTLSSLPTNAVDRLLSDHLPPEILTLAVVSSTSLSAPSTAQEALAALSETEKRKLLERVLRSPQFSQALSSITSAIRDGGLPSVAEALGVKLGESGGYVPGTGEAVNGGEAIEVFLDGVKRGAEKDAGNSRDKDSQ